MSRKSRDAATSERSTVNRLDGLNVADDLDQRRAGLERRLEDGYRRIEEAALAGSDVAEWETFWVRLLHEYEGICRELDTAA
jgi:hypothetical protein